MQQAMVAMNIKHQNFAISNVVFLFHSFMGPTVDSIQIKIAILILT